MAAALAASVLSTGAPEPATAPHFKASPPLYLVLAPQGQADDGRRAVALSLASLPPAAQRSVARRLREALDRLAFRMSPLAVDLEGGDPTKELREILGAQLPRFTAAAALYAGPQVATRCPEGARCVAAWGPATDAGEARARFRAWPVASAVLLDAGSQAEAERVATQLRERAGSAALVLTAEMPPTDSIAARDLCRAAARVARFRGRSLWMLDGLARFDPLQRATHPVPLRPEWVMVIPRLSALATLRSFAEDIRRALGSAPVTWLASGA